MTVFRNESHLFVSKVLIKFEFSTTYRAIEYRHMCNTKLVFQLQSVNNPLSSGDFTLSL